MLALVGTCCISFETGQTFKPIQTDATLLLANNMQHCWAQHVASVCMEPKQCWHLLALAGTCCISFETGQTFKPIQTDATLLLANNTEQLLRLFAVVRY